MQLLDQIKKTPFDRIISPLKELGAFEALWAQNNTGFKILADKFANDRGALLSDFVSCEDVKLFADKTLQLLQNSGVKTFGVQVHGNHEYPAKLQQAQHPTELIYYQGWWDLIFSTPSIAIVGTRSPSEEGVARTRKLVRNLVHDQVTIVSGLAKGIDTAAHKACLEFGGRTIAVLGTPISRAYPQENKELQQSIASDHLLVSQVPICRYEQAPNPVINRFFFPQRNIMMSAISDATVIVEAGQTSGTLIQAKAAISQGRKLFIMNSCFENSNITWPQKFENLGAIRLRSYDDIKEHVFSKEIIKN